MREVGAIGGRAGSAPGWWAVGPGEKFLVARDGTVVRRFAPSITPDDPVILAAVDDELAR